ncbi:MAG: methylated-DNA--[protein]-cysteine S-methyltransferase [Clostridiales bacterium]|nr:methylated-DNA--[protein]-cysteine S-methyltransferase [Clostridiales bacterium]
MYINFYPSPFGNIALTATETALTGLCFENQRHYDEIFEAARSSAAKDLPVFKQTREWLDIYFQGKNPGPVPPLHMEGTPFRLAVWDILKTIPYGQTTTYGKIAEAIAAQRGISHMSAQAVGGAVGHNPISILVPCHRVIGSDGSLTGYDGGIERKVSLLQLEGILKSND